jgi:hypothetical protein
VADFSNYQKKIIQRYYDNREAISLQKLGELVSELYMADSEKKTERLWQRVGQAMAALKVPEKVANHIMARRDVELLANHVQEWGRNPPK